MAQIALPHQLSNGTVADASQVMANFNAIVDVVNGNLGSDNLGSISATDVAITDINGGTGILDNFTQRFQVGSVDFENVQPEEFVTKYTNFPVAFPGSPRIFLSINAGSGTEVYTSASDISSTDFRIAVRNKYYEPRSFNINWLAIYTGAMS